MITNKQFIDFLHGVFSNDAIRSSFFGGGFEIVKLELKDNILNATYQFIFKSEDNYDWTLFEMGEDWNNKHFPKGIVICTINEDFIWRSNDTLNILDKNDVVSDMTNMSYGNYLWDDKNLSEDWIDCFFENYDKYSVGGYLAETFSASKDNIPEFIPNRIRSRIKSCIDEYLNFKI